MEIRNADDARSFAADWSGHPGASRHLKRAAESQRRCAEMARELGRPREAAGHDAAAAVLVESATQPREER
jgi:hypothetical protein